MARPSNSAARRDQIAAALARLLPTTGFAGATTKAIAREAGLSPGLVHHHFTDKGEILVAVVDRLATALAARAPARDAAVPPHTQVHDLLDAWLQPGPGDDPTAVACWAALGAEAVRHPAVAEVYRSAVEAHVARLATALAAAAPHRSPQEVRAVAASLHATIEGSFRLHASAPGVIPPGSAAATLRGLVDAWLAAP